MKICPVCNTQYEDDDLQKCAKDGTPLVALAKLPENPPLVEVESAPPDAVTSDFDVEAVRHEYNKLESAAEKEVVNQTEIKELDVKPTSAPAIDAHSTFQPPPEPTHPPVPPIAPTTKPKKNRWVMFFVALLVLIGAATGVYFWLKGSELVRVQLKSNPPGATVLLDGHNIGMSPIEVRVAKGLHRVVFQHSGYQTIEETIFVPSNGHVVVKQMSPISSPPATP